jgi:kumamolisin
MSEHVLLPGSARAVLTGTENVGRVAADQRVAFTVILRRRADLPGDLVEGPATVSSDELADRFGADPDDVALVRSTFEAAGVTVTEAHAVSRRLTAEGPAAAVSALFGTELSIVRSADPTGGDPVEHRARSGALRVPAALAGIVVAVLGLDNRPQVRPRVRAHAREAAPIGFEVPTLAGVYDFPPGTDGTGQIAAIVEFGGGYGQDDLDTFFADLDLPTPSVTAVGVDGAQNAPGQGGADSEVLLDVEVFGALAPKARQLVYFAPNTDQGFVDAVSMAVHATPMPAVVSISWGMSEDMWTEQARSALNEVFADAAALGVTVCAATGDNGSQDADNDGAQHVDFPAGSPYVLACGGTKLTVGADGAVATESVWNDGEGKGATGGGVSDTTPVPSWQANAGVPPRSGGTAGGRGVPDVAANADPVTGYRVRVNGKAIVLGGTSAVAPLWAALVCRLTQAVGRPLGLLQPVLYAAAGTATCGFRDVTDGANGAYTAATGWDPCTGLGVPRGTELLTLFTAVTADTPAPPPAVATAPDTAVAAAPGTVSSSGS